MYKRTCENCEHREVCDRMRKDLYQHLEKGCTYWEGWVDATDELPSGNLFDNFVVLHESKGMQFITTDLIGCDGLCESNYKRVKWYSKPFNPTF